MSQAHTPTPWRSLSMSRNGYLESVKLLVDANGDEVCRIDYEAMPNGAQGIKHSDANAAFIVKAVNSHEELLSFARAMDAHDSPLWPWVNEKNIGAEEYKRRSAIVEGMRAALSKVGA